MAFKPYCHVCNSWHQPTELHVMKLDPDEREEVHAARVTELCAGEISGKEYVASCVTQVGLTSGEAREQWQALKDGGRIAIYDQAGPRVMVEYPFPVIDAKKITGFVFKRGMITSVYAKDGAIVQTAESPFSSRVPFSLFELRLAK